MIHITKQQMRQFILHKHGLIGGHKFTGKKGALEFINQAGCIQFDPVDLCGKNAELTLQSRVKGFKKDMLNELLYKDRALFDYPDKQLSIIPTEYWPYFSRLRQAAQENLTRHPEIQEHIESFRSYISENGAICSNDIKLDGTTSWWSAINWSSGGKMSRSVLEQMYSSGDLVVHHKKGARRYYDLAERHFSPVLLKTADPLPDDFAHQKWCIARRIGAAGLLWNRNSDALIGIWGLTASTRSKVFESLLLEGVISEIVAEGRKFYILSKDIPILDEVLKNPPAKIRCEFIAPLDPLMWDRKLINFIFDFHYSWEIYTPPQKRKYGAYVLPILYGENFIGRIEAVCERKTQTLIVKNIWYEDNVKQTAKLKKEVNECVKNFADFNDCGSITWI